MPSKERSLSTTLQRHPSKAMNSDTPTLVSVRYLAARLGVNVRTVWRLISGDKDFPRPATVGRCTRFASSDVESYTQRILARRKLL